MKTRTAKAQWKGALKDGEGKVTFGSHTLPYSFPSRFEEGDGTNPEELVGAAHAGCFAMALAHELSSAGYKVNSVDATANVTIDKGDDGFFIAKIALEVNGDIDEIDSDEFVEIATSAKNNCPLSKALASVPEITLDARLV